MKIINTVLESLMVGDCELSISSANHTGREYVINLVYSKPTMDCKKLLSGADLELSSRMLLQIILKM